MRGVRAGVLPSHRRNQRSNGFGCCWGTFGPNVILFTRVFSGLIVLDWIFKAIALATTSVRIAARRSNSGPSSSLALVCVDSCLQQLDRKLSPFWVTNGAANEATVRRTHLPCARLCSSSRSFLMSATRWQHALPQRRAPVETRSIWGESSQAYVTGRRPRRRRPAWTGSLAISSGAHSCWVRHAVSGQDSGGGKLCLEMCLLASSPKYPGDPPPTSSTALNSKWTSTIPLAAMEKRRRRNARCSPKTSCACFSVLSWWWMEIWRPQKRRTTLYSELLAGARVPLLSADYRVLQHGFNGSHILEDAFGVVSWLHEKGPASAWTRAVP